jgi:hypothetical protein
MATPCLMSAAAAANKHDHIQKSPERRTRPIIGPWTLKTGSGKSIWHTLRRRMKLCYVLESF